MKQRFSCTGCGTCNDTSLRSGCHLLHAFQSQRPTFWLLLQDPSQQQMAPYVKEHQYAETSISIEDVVNHKDVLMFGDQLVLQDVTAMILSQVISLFFVCKQLDYRFLVVMLKEALSTTSRSVVSIFYFRHCQIMLYNIHAIIYASSCCTACHSTTELKE